MRAAFCLAQISIVAASVLRRFWPRLSEPAPCALPVIFAMPPETATLLPIFAAVAPPTESERSLVNDHLCVSAGVTTEAVVVRLRSRLWTLFALPPMYKPWPPP